MRVRGQLLPPKQARLLRAMARSGGECRPSEGVAKVDKPVECRRLVRRLVERGAAEQIGPDAWRLTMDGWAAVKPLSI